MAAIGKADPRFTALVAKAGRPPLRRREDGFAGLAAIIVAQQLSTASANAIWGRLAAAFDPLEPSAILSARPARLARLGLSGPKSARSRRSRVRSSARNLRSPRSASFPPKRRTRRSPPCTASARGLPTFICCRCLGHADAWPAGDLALQEAARVAFGLADKADRQGDAGTGGAMAAVAGRRRPNPMDLLSRRRGGRQRSQRGQNRRGRNRRRRRLTARPKRRASPGGNRRKTRSGRAPAARTLTTPSLPAATTFRPVAKRFRTPSAAASRFLTCIASCLFAGAWTSAG